MKTKWKIVLALFGLVLVSAASGALVGAKVSEHADKKRHAPEVWKQSIMRSLHSRLNLTPEQAQKAQIIIGEGVEEMKAIRLETIARTDAIVSRMVSDFDRDLTPEQSAELHKFVKERASPMDLMQGQPRKR